MRIIASNTVLLLREFDLGDASQLYLLNKDPEVLRFTGDKAFESLEEAEAFLRAYACDAYETHKMGRWAVERKSDGKFLGWCGLKRHEDGMVDLGFRFLKKEWRKGYASQSAKLSLAYGFEQLGLSEIVLRSNPQNLASIKIAEKLGMIFWKQEIVPGLGNAHWYKIKRQPSR